MLKVSIDSLKKGLGLEKESSSGKSRSSAGSISSGSCGSPRSGSSDGCGQSSGRSIEAGEELYPFGRGLDAGRWEGSEASAYQLTPDQGVSVTPKPITKGQRVTVKYNGLLARSGAQEVFLHYGFGPGDWRNQGEIRMGKQPDGTWVGEIQAGDSGTLSFCFRDNAYNWDNNNGLNWNYEIHTGSVV